MTQHTTFRLAAIAGCLTSLFAASAVWADDMVVTPKNGRFVVQQGGSESLIVQPNGQVAVPALAPASGGTQFVCAQAGGALLGCEAPAPGTGEQGPRGEQGQAGPQGAAGENGGRILTGTTSPAEDVGSIGPTFSPSK